MTCKTAAFQAAVFDFAGFSCRIIHKTDENERNKRYLVDSVNLVSKKQEKWKNPDLKNGRYTTGVSESCCRLDEKKEKGVR
ncbi:MAG: hypothetical protein K6E18_10590 [Lachnospiraceae bacterium]|nr:hypothetical protein [Lachnospiraceae bacterium]